MQSFGNLLNDYSTYSRYRQLTLVCLTFMKSGGAMTFAAFDEFSDITGSSRSECACHLFKNRRQGISQLLKGEFVRGGLLCRTAFSHAWMMTSERARRAALSVGKA